MCNKEPTTDQRRDRYEARRKKNGEHRVNARFTPEDVRRLRALIVRYGSEAAALRAAVRVAFDALPPEQQALFGTAPVHSPAGKRVAAD